ncbi:MAG: hypothetical protein IPG71_01835 [bacterium]|nr:hypothetical protein [bacterium]
MKHFTTTTLIACLSLVLSCGCDNDDTATGGDPGCSWQQPPAWLQGTVSYNTASNAYGSDTLWNQTLEFTWSDTSVYDDSGLLVDGWSGVGTRTVHAPGNPNATYRMRCEASAWTSLYYEGYLYMSVVDDSLLSAAMPDTLVAQGLSSIACNGENGLSGSFMGVRGEQEWCWGNVHLDGTH